MEVFSKKYKFDSINYFLVKYNKDVRQFYTEGIKIKDSFVVKAYGSISVNGNKYHSDKKYLDINDTVDVKIKLNNTKYHYIFAR